MSIRTALREAEVARLAGRVAALSIIDVIRMAETS